MAEIQAKLQSLSDEFTKLQQDVDLQETVQSRQKLEAQKQENLGVQKEFKNLKDTETIYKLIGPVLLKQDRSDAESTVNGRLEFIDKEMLRCWTTMTMPATACRNRHDLSWSPRPASMRPHFSVTIGKEPTSQVASRMRSRVEDWERASSGSQRLKMALVLEKHCLRSLKMHASGGRARRPWVMLRGSRQVSMLAGGG
ncbi:Prefoldin [Staphylotrichum tortipilum]|uniref:Prefoldin n=1 Tax=Staphylotrichum tortipilum TaxID=2831512 RepID=A0AAN6MLN2_9PEZI|nr:Prefoldin [Staphylotrichum longicolle]